MRGTDQKWICYTLKIPPPPPPPPPFTASWNWDTSCRFNLLHTVSSLSERTETVRRCSWQWATSVQMFWSFSLSLFTPAPSLLTRPTPRPYWRRPTSSSSTLSAKSVSPSSVRNWQMKCFPRYFTKIVQVIQSLNCMHLIQHCMHYIYIYI